MPAFGARFSLDAIDAGGAWKIFWSAIDPQSVKGSLLFAAMSESAAEKVYVIALQSMSQAIISGARGALASSEAFAANKAEPSFAETDELDSLQLKPFGNVSSSGRLEGDGGIALEVLREVRPEAAMGAGPQTAAEAPKGFASKSTTIGSHAARAFLSGNTNAGSARQGSGPGTTRKTTVRRERSSKFKIGVAIVIVAFILGLGVMMYYRVEHSVVDGEEPLPMSAE
jgi:hypothetical protein